MKRTLLTTCLVVATAFLSTHAIDAHAADVSLTINGVGDKGNVMVALYKKDDKWLGKSTMGTMVAAKKEGVTVSFKDLPEGEYAVSLFVDENSNGKMDTNAIGIPVEAYGFSNDASGNFGPPSFEQAKFIVGKDKTAITITLK
jgi:uncharacterized protein (DUF2141 family)